MTNLFQFPSFRSLCRVNSAPYSKTGAKYSATFSRLAKVLLFSGCFFVSGSALQAQGKKQVAVPPVIKYPWLQQSVLNSQSDTVQVVNLWATWCKPCVHEIPGFLRVAEAFKGKPVKFLFVSLDFKQDLKRKLVPFINKQQITQPVALLNEPDYNSWIPKLEPGWGGSIPATLIFNNHTRKRLFIERELTEQELTDALNDMLK